MRIIGVEVAPEHGFGRALLEGVSDYAARKCDARLRSVSPTALPRASAASALDGLIVRLLDEKAYRRAKALQVPVVDIYGERPRPGIAIVCGDYRQIAQLAARLFISRGFENIGWCGVDGLVFSSETKRHFSELVRDSGRSYWTYDAPRSLTDVIVCNAPDHIPDARDMREWIRSVPKPCAVFCCNDHRACQLMRVAVDCGIAIPEELSILGVDNDTTLCAFADVPISSIDPDAFRMGQTAARVLDAMIGKHVDDKPHRPVLIPPKCLIERQSTQHIPTSPAWLSHALMSIERNLASGINVTEVVAGTGRSETVVERTFKKKFGLSIIAYITKQRMQRAQNLLATTDLSAKEIAAACGFSSLQYFCRVFKAHYGHTTTQRVRPRPMAVSNRQLALVRQLPEIG